MTTTRRDIRERIGDIGYCGDLVLSTALTGSSASQLVDTTLKYSDSAFVGASVYVTSGSAENDERTIVGWTQSSGIMLPDRNFSAAIANADTYAILDAIWRWPRKIEDTSIAQIQQTLTYALAGLTVPIDPIEGIDKLEYDTEGSGTGYEWGLIDDDNYRIRNNDGVLTLQLNDEPPSAGDNFRITYRVRPPQFTADTGAGGTLIPNSQAFCDFLTARATAILMAWMSSQHEEGSVRDQWLTRASIFQSLADNLFSQNAEQKLPGSVKYPTVGGSTGRGSILGGNQDRIRL
jgi:hypothetical protein